MQGGSPPALGPRSGKFSGFERDRSDFQEKNESALFDAEQLQMMIFGILVLELKPPCLKLGVGPPGCVKARYKNCDALDLERNSWRFWSENRPKHKKWGFEPNF